jgi:hypothetical protein
MLLTKSQLSRFWREWAGIVKKNGWDSTTADQRRKDLLSRCGFTSLTLVDTRAGFDRVLAELGAERDDLKRTAEIADPTIGEARRLRQVIRAEILPCLALYEPDPERYLQAVIADKIRWSKTDKPTRPPTIDDLTATPTYRRVPPCFSLKEFPSQLEQVLMTLNARLHSKRKAHGDTIHDMRTRAGFQCSCRACTSKPVRTSTPADPDPDPDPQEEAWFEQESIKEAETMEHEAATSDPF